MPDQLSALYGELLEGAYDCVDRIVLNAFFSMGMEPGGLRVWWRALYGSDTDLDNAHLMRMAGRFGRRLRAWAKYKGIPVVDCPPGQRKHELAEEYLATHTVKPGLFMVLVAKSQAVVWDVRMSGTGKIGDIARKKPMPYVNHYHFHILDPDWGHVTIKMSGHPPFGAQVMLNGHEYVACQATRKHVEFTKEGNCFTGTTNALGLAKVADTLSHERITGRLREVCERWIYSTCLIFALDLDEQNRSAFQYQFSTYQMEYSRNLLFQIGGQMEQVFQTFIDRSRAPLNLDRVKTIFGDRYRPHRRRREKNASRWGVVVETPTYDLTVFKIHYGKLVLKVYSKGERVLRIEVIIENTRDLKVRRSLDEFPNIVHHLRGILGRFLDSLSCLEACFIADSTLENLPSPSQLGKTRVGGLDLNKSRTRLVLESVLSLSTSPSGFTASDLTDRTKQLGGPSDYTARRAAYDIRKLRAKGLVKKLQKSRRYQPTPKGLRAIAALVVLRDKVIKPLLAANLQTKRGPKPKNRTTIDEHYDRVRSEMRGLFTALGIAA
jgi:hypothetical protein